MSFVRNKVINGKKYAYEITSYWDHDSKSSKQKSKYLGIVDSQNNIIKKSNEPSIEHLILDFGNGYLLHKFMQTSILQSILTKCSMKYMRN